MHQSVIDALPGFLEQYEGKVNFMYLDVKGLVTVGVGHLIDPVHMALKLEFGPKGGGGPVSAAEVTAEWQKIKARKDIVNKGGEAFGAITSLVLTDKGIKKMVLDDANAIENYIKTKRLGTKVLRRF